MGATGKAHTDSVSHKTLHRMRFIFPYFLAFLVALFTELFDPFHQISLHREISAETAQVMVEPLFDLVTHANERNEAARKAITVFIIDRDTQSDRKDGGVYAFDTPFMPYAFQAAYIRQIAAYKPRVIFLDFTYRRRSTGDGFDDFAQALSDARQAGIKVFVGLSADPQKFAALGGSADVVSNEWPRGRHVLDYPFVGDGVLDDPSRQTTLTAAAAIYNDVCAGPQKNPLFRCDFKPSPAQTGDAALAPMVVQWHQFVRRPQELYSEEPACSGEPTSALGAYMKGAARNILYNLTDPEHFGPDKCLYISAFPLDRVFSFAAFHRPDDELLKQYVTGKIVMIGDGLDDYFDTPEHGRIPGVFHHAFALQNLLADGRGYIRWPFEWHPLNMTMQFNFLVEWFLVAFEIWITLKFEDILKWADKLVERLDKIARRMTWLLHMRRLRLKDDTPYALLVSVLIIFALAYILDLWMYAGLHWVPINPLYVLVIVSAIHVIAEQDKLFAQWLDLKTSMRVASVALPLMLIIAAIVIAGLCLRTHGP